MTHSCVFNSLFFIFFCFIDEHHFDFFLGFSDNDIQMRTELLPPPQSREIFNTVSNTAADVYYFTLHTETKLFHTNQKLPESKL